MSGPAGRRRSQRGATAVETAIVLPVLLFVIFGVIDFSRMLNAQLQLTEAAREGVRAEVLDADPAARVQRAVSLTGVTTQVVTACPATPTKDDNGVVTTAYRFQFITPMGALASLLGAAFDDDTVTLTGRAAQICTG
ncbi:MAG: hypothetical protein QOI74_2986 [Micromonosporaceae bacterium]|jgi:Flp pilus assembly protein TadG|nr:hypothetical protein [Micromonosporaceae bacterium]